MANSSRTHPFHSWGQVPDRGLQHLQILTLCFLGKRKQPSCSLILSKAGASVCKTGLQNRFKKGPSGPNMLFLTFTEASSLVVHHPQKQHHHQVWGLSCRVCSLKGGQGLTRSLLKPSRAWLTGQEGLITNLFCLLPHPHHEYSPHPPHS